MANIGPARPIVSRLANKMFVHAALFMIVAVVVAIKATPGKADPGIARSSERFHKTVPLNRKIGASSGFGLRKDPINKNRDFHKGIDISRPSGTKVFSWSDGTVAKAGWMGDYGYAVDVLHPNGVKTRYAHLRAVQVREGQRLLAGQTLGQVGRTGRTTGANLHFEVMVNGRLVDPRKHLSEAAQIVSRRNNQGG